MSAIGWRDVDRTYEGDWLVVEAGGLGKGPAYYPIGILCRLIITRHLLSLHSPIRCNEVSCVAALERGMELPIRIAWSQPRLLYESTGEVLLVFLREDTISK